MLTPVSAPDIPPGMTVFGSDAAMKCGLENLLSYSDHSSGSELLVQYPIRGKVKQLRDE
jgi:hypothetical protein